MSYDARKSQNGELIVYPLELPMYEGNNSELGQQALSALASALRHFAVVDSIEQEGLEDPNAGEPNDILNTHYAHGTEQLISCMMSLASIADNYGIDIMQEILEIPWLV
ncbi:MAG: hypothetical protein J5965_10200 [Aeriscardovia sp.]|nr:hypothetical protein [Aeriscardovia sp.]